MNTIKITRKHKVIVCKIYQFIRKNDRSLLNIRKSTLMTFSKLLLLCQTPYQIYNQ